MATDNRNLEQSITGRKATPEEVAYRDGYVQGRLNENHEQRYQRARDAQLYESNARARANDSAATGLIVGLIMAIILGTVGAIFYFAGQESVDPAVIDVEPPQPEAAQPEENSGNTTIIERTIERTQEVVPRTSDIELPDINLEVPNPVEAEPDASQPAAEPQTEGEGTTPQPQPQAPAGETESSAE